MSFNPGPLKPFPPNFDFTRYARVIELHKFFGRRAERYQWIVDDPNIAFTSIGPLKQVPSDYQPPKVRNF